MENLVLRQLDGEVAFGGHEGVAEAHVCDAINQCTKLDDDLTGGDLLVQSARWHAGVDPRRDHGGIEAEFFQTVTS